MGSKGRSRGLGSGLMAAAGNAEQRLPRADALRSRDAILLAAREVFAQDAAAGVDVIAARAGVHRATLYRHFATRETLVSGLYEAYLDDAEATVLKTDVQPADPLAEIKALTRRVSTSPSATCSRHGAHRSCSSPPASARAGGRSTRSSSTRCAC